MPKEVNVDQNPRLAELSRIVWRWRSGHVSRRTALRLLTSLGLSLGGGLAARGTARGMDHHPGHFDQGNLPPESEDWVLHPGITAPTVVDTDYTVDPEADEAGNYASLKNPERGMYFLADPGEAMLPDGTLDPRRLWHTVVAKWLWLAPVCNQDLTWDRDNPDLTSPVLRDYATMLDEARGKGVKVLFRPRYDKDEAGSPPSDCTFAGGSARVYHADSKERQFNHIDAVAKMLGDYKDVVAFIQAGYLGKWGEWNEEGGASAQPLLTNRANPDDLNTYDRTHIIDHILSKYAAAGIKQDVELRTPVFAKEVVERYEQENKPPPNIGLHNDCFMSSRQSDEVPVDGSDSGTYSDFKPPDGSPYNFNNAVLARAWAADWTADSSFGGETCPRDIDLDKFSDENERWRVCANMIGAKSEPALLHMNYLNGDYLDDKVRPSGELVPGAVTTWLAGGCYDEIQRKLGYRFEVRGVKYTPTLTEDQKFLVSVDIENTGWGKLHKPRNARLVLRNGTSPSLKYTFSGGPVSSWAPGTTRTISVIRSAPPPGTYEVRLWIPDPDAKSRIAYAVKLATLRDGDPVFDPVTGENNLGVTITVQQPVDRVPPVISDVWAESASNNRATVRWRTSEPADSQVEYGRTASLGFRTPLDKTLRVLHVAILTSLVPETHYRFVIKSRDGAGNLATATGGFANPALPR